MNRADRTGTRLTLERPAREPAADQGVHATTAQVRGRGIDRWSSDGPAEELRREMANAFTSAGPTVSRLRRTQMRLALLAPLAPAGGSNQI
jgi:hypothetical protein